MEIKNDTIILRDFAIGHLPGRVRFETADTEWKLWDAPWEHEGLSAEEEKAELDALLPLLHARARRNMSLGEGELRHGFEIFARDTGAHIGWVNSYSLDDEMDYSQAATRRTAVGIVIADPAQRGSGRGTAALGLFISHLLGHGLAELYTQTWSGNAPMLALAGRLGFEECLRKPGLRTVRGQTYDGLTLRLDVPAFRAAWGQPL